MLTNRLTFLTILSYLFSRFILFSFADGDVSGGGSPSPPPASPPPVDNTAAINGLIERHDKDMRAVIQTLFQENYGYREKIRELKDANKTLKESQPKGDQAVLSKEDATLLESYKALGTPDELTTQATTLQTTNKELTTLKKESTLRDAASAHGYKFAVLRTLAGELDLEIKQEEVEVDGKKEMKAVAYVKDGDNAVKLSDYADSHWQDFKPSLTDTPAESQPAQQAGTQFPQQNPGSSAAPRGPDIVKDFVKKRNEQRAGLPNPLLNNS